jgi:F-type H+-transporting ATPase subunit a
MEEHVSAIAELINRLAHWLVHLVGLSFPEDQMLVTQTVSMVLVVMILLITLSLIIRRQLSVDNPGNLQQVFEVLFEAVRGLMQDMIGSNSRRYFPFLASLGLFILAGNWLGNIPGFISPTANINCTAALGISSFVFYNYHGVRHQGVLKYLKHFAGPVIFIAPLLFIIEIVSHLARPFSLSVRLFGNIFAEELIVNTLNQALFPFLVSIPVMFLALLLSSIQAFLFILLSMVYIGGAVEDSHGHEAEAH